MLRLLRALALAAFALGVGAQLIHAAATTQPTASARPAAPDSGKWELALDTLGDGAKAVTATLTADAPIPSGFDKVTPKLVLRYRAGRTSAFIMFDTFLGRDAVDVILTYGEAAPEQQKWPISKDGRSAIVPDDALAFIDRLKRVDSFSIRIQPRREPLTATFSPKGIDVVIKALLSAGVKYGT